MFKCFQDYTGVEMPPSLRIRQKCTAIKIIIIKGSPINEARRNAAMLPLQETGHQVRQIGYHWTWLQN